MTKSKVQRALLLTEGKGLSWKCRVGGYECHIIQAQCARNADYRGSFVETTRDERCARVGNEGFRNACDQNVCLGRAKVWHEWCRNPPGAQTTAWHKASTWFATWPELTDDIQERMELLARQEEAAPPASNRKKNNGSGGGNNDTRSAWEEFVSGLPPSSSTEKGRSAPPNQKSGAGYSPPAWSWGGHHRHWGHAWWGWLVGHYRRKFGYGG